MHCNDPIATHDKTHGQGAFVSKMLNIMNNSIIMNENPMNLTDMQRLCILQISETGASPHSILHWQQILSDGVPQHVGMYITTATLCKVASHVLTSNQ